MYLLINNHSQWAGQLYSEKDLIGIWHVKCMLIMCKVLSAYGGNVFKRCHLPLEATTLFFGLSGPPALYEISMSTRSIFWKSISISWIES